MLTQFRFDILRKIGNDHLILYSRKSIQIWTDRSLPEHPSQSQTNQLDLVELTFLHIPISEAENIVYGLPRWIDVGILPEPNIYR